MLEVFDLACHRKGKTILENISFEVQPGEFVAVLGANGAGKSSLLKCLTGEWKATAGEMVIDAIRLSCWRKDALAKKRAFMAQHHPTDLHFQVFDIVAMGRYPYSKGKLTTEDTKEIIGVLKKTGLWSFRNRVYTSLSGGEQQRVQLARVLAQIGLRNTEKKILLLDEPVNHLDVNYQHQMMDISKDMAAAGHAVLSVLHDINMAALYADRLLILKNGKQLALGRPEEIITSDVIFDAFGYKAIVQQNPIYNCPMVLALQNKTFSKSAFVA